MTTLRERIAWITARLFGSLWPAVEPALPDLSPRDGAINDAGAYGVTLIAAQPPLGTTYWKVTRVRHLLPQENHGNHHIYFDMLDESGNRLLGSKVRITWEGGSEVVTMAKSPPEPAADFPMWKYQVCDVSALGVPGQELPSDRVSNLHTGHRDEAPGNTLFHHSFAVVFQRTLAGPPQPLAGSVAEGHVGNGAGLVVLLRKAGATVAQQTVGVDEAFRFADLSAGSYVVAVQGRNVQSDPFTLDGQNRMVIELTLPPPLAAQESTVSGRIGNGAGRTLDLQRGSDLVASAHIAVDELYIFTALAAGTYHLVVSGSDVVSDEFTLDGTDSLVVDLSLPALADGKRLAHYVLFAPLDDAPGSVDWLVAVPYIQMFGLAAGTQAAHAALARRVTIIGSGAHAVPATTEQALIAAGCQVERLSGPGDAIEAELARRITLGRP